MLLGELSSSAAGEGGSVVRSITAEESARARRFLDSTATSKDGARAVLPYSGTLLIQCSMYSHHVLTITTRIDVMNRLGRAMADPTRSRILITLLDGPSYPAILSRDLGLGRSNVSNHLTCLRDCGIVVAQTEGRQTRYEIADPHLGRALTALVDVTLAVEENAPCLDPACSIAGCCEATR